MNKSFKKISLMLTVAGAVAFSNPAIATDNKEGIVRGSYVNLRAEPKFNSEIVGKKLRGDTYQIKFEQQRWLKVVFKDNVEGWIYKTLIESGNTEVESEKKSSENKKDTDDKKTVTSSPEIKKEPTKKAVASADKKDEKPLIKPVDKKKLPDVVAYSGTAEELYNEAIKLYEKRKYSEALEKNLAASKKAPKNAEILNNLGNCQFKLGRIEESLSSWKEALKLSPRSGKICNNLGIAYYQLDKPNDAIEYYKKAITFEPDFADPHYNLASVYGFTGEYEESVKYYKKYLEFKPDNTMRRLAEERIAYCEKQFSKKQK